jgi:GNAT superfamily N-acetyltransferase
MVHNIIAREGATCMQYSNNLHARCSNIELAGEPLILQTDCPTWLIEELQTDRGLVAFARRPEREHPRLLEIARHPGTSLSLAYTPAGVIVGQLTLAPVSDWWQEMDGAYEIAIEVSSSWRRKGLAHRLLNLTLEREGIEDLIILALCFSWHWDIKEADLTHAAYRNMLIQALSHYNFIECLTTEPNISMDPFNVLLARIGIHVPLEKTLQFYQDLIR